MRRLYSSAAKDILKNGFERIGADKLHKKSPQELEKLVSAGRELGIAAPVIKQIYESVTPGVREKSGISSEDRARTDKFDLEMFETPSAQQFGRAFEYDDLPSAAHLQLEEHRDLRALVRAAAYDLPLLAQYRSEYRRPTPQQNLRFRYYAFPSESHPAAKKVVVEFAPESTGLEGAALHKLKLLAGPRYFSASNTIKIACSKFPQQAQNKRFLGTIYERLVEAARDSPAEFADVKLDPRADLKREAKSKRNLYPQFEWPEEWNREDRAPKKKEDILTTLA